MTFRRIRTVVLAVVLTAAVHPAAAWAGQPTDNLRGYVDRVLAVLDDPAMKGSGHAAERQRAIQAVADEGLALRETARRTLTQHWDARTPAEQARFIELFTRLIYGSYLARVAGYDGERIVYDGEAVTGGEAIVNARVIAKDGDVTPVEFHLVRNGDARWQVWDASFEGMSLVGNYRAQFTRIIRTASFADLVKRLESHSQATK
jgi:phospholipid transport system substrate-binding protein